MSFCTKELELGMFNLNKREGIKKEGCKELRHFSVVPGGRTMGTKLKHRRIPPEHQEMLFLWCGWHGYRLPKVHVESPSLQAFKCQLDGNLLIAICFSPTLISFQVLGEKICSGWFFWWADIQDVTSFDAQLIYDWDFPLSIYASFAENLLNRAWWFGHFVPRSYKWKEEL